MSDGFLELGPGESSAAGFLAPVEPPVVVPMPPTSLPGRPHQVPASAHEFARPAYSERFQCISSACEDTCCQGWGVPIDQPTFEKYRDHELLRPFVGTLIVLNANNPTHADYARLPLTNTGTCGFLDDRKMCGIQKKLGPEMLSETCQVYPRAVSNHAGQMEKALNLSCPEAARVVLLEPRLLSGNTWVEVGWSHYAEVSNWAEQPLRAEDAKLAVRQFGLLLLTDRSYPIWQRIYLLGILVRRLQALAGDMPAGAWCEAHPASVEALLSESARVATNGLVRATMDAIQGQPAEQLQFVTAMLRLRIPGPPMPPRFIECVQEFEAGLGCNNTTEAAILAAYTEAHERYYRPLMEQNPHLLENFLINHLFKNGYPFGRKTDSTTPEAEHLALCVHFAAVQTLLIGMARQHKDSFSTAHVVKLVQSLAKTIEHGKVYLEQVAAFVEEKGLNNLRGVALLVRQES